MKTDVRTIAFSGIFTALALFIILAGYFLQVGEFLWYVIAMLVLVLAGETYPTVHIYTYLCSVVLLLIFTSFNFIFLMPYIVFFGLYPIISKSIQDFKKPLKYSIKWTHYICSLFTIILLTKLFININLDNPLIVIKTIVFGTVTFVGFELMYNHARSEIVGLSTKLKSHL